MGPKEASEAKKLANRGSKNLARARLSIKPGSPYRESAIVANKEEDPTNKELLIEAFEKALKQSRFNLAAKNGDPKLAQLRIKEIEEYEKQLGQL